MSLKVNGIKIAGYGAPGKDGPPGKSAYEYAKEGGYAGTETEFSDLIGGISIIPSGLISLWHGIESMIPTGWALCNGENGTPDLRDRFIVGAGNTYTVGDIGGENAVTLTIDQMTNHTHTFTGTPHNHGGTVDVSGLTADSAGGHTHTYSTYGYSGSSGSGGNMVSSASIQYGNNSSLKMNTAGSHTHTISGSGTATINEATAGGTNSSTGGGQAHENRPPYYALCYIMKL